MRLGKGISPDFFKQIIPDLIELGVLGEVQWKGGGFQKRYRLIAPLSDVHEALEKSAGSYDNFLAGLSGPRREGAATRKAPRRLQGFPSEELIRGFKLKAVRAVWVRGYQWHRLHATVDLASD